MKMKPPVNFGGATVQGISIAASEDGSAEVPPHLADELRSHGFLDWPLTVAASPVVEDNGALSDGDEFDKMNRTALFAWASEHGVSAVPGDRNATLRAKCRNAAAEALKTPLLLSPPEQTAAPIDASAAADPSPPKVSGEQEPPQGDEFDLLDRNGLVAWLAAKGVTAPSEAHEGDLRAACRQIATALKNPG